jgi:hypothetical protein
VQSETKEECMTVAGTSIAGEVDRLIGERGLLRLPYYYHVLAFSQHVCAAVEAGRAS